MADEKTQKEETRRERERGRKQLTAELLNPCKGANSFMARIGHAEGRSGHVTKEREREREREKRARRMRRIKIAEDAQVSRVIRRRVNHKRKGEATTCHLQDRSVCLCK